jgi:hypothetical protein
MFTAIGESYVGSKFAADLVAQAHPTSRSERPDPIRREGSPLL